MSHTKMWYSFTKCPFFVNENSYREGVHPLDLEHERRLTEVESRAERNEGRIKKLEGEHEALNKLATSVAVMAEKQDTMNDNVAKLTEKVDHIESKPGKKWESMEEKVLWSIVAAALGFILAQVGL